MPVTRKKTSIARPEPSCDAVLSEVVGLIEAARRASTRAVNALMTATYWGIGRRIVEQGQHGAARAGYGEELIVRLSDDLRTRFGRGFGRANLFQMRAFYLAYREILQTSSGESTSAEALQKVQTASGQSLGHAGLAAVAGRLPLPWSHYVRLLSVRNVEARRFYEDEALRGGWTIRQLDRQIGTQFYERTALSRNKAAMLRRGESTSLRSGGRRQARRRSAGRCEARASQRITPARSALPPGCNPDLVQRCECHNESAENALIEQIALTLRPRVVPFA